MTTQYVGPPLYEYNGKSMTIYEWSAHLSEEWGEPISQQTLRMRLERNDWPVEQAFTIRVGEKRDLEEATS